MTDTTSPTPAEHTARPVEYPVQTAGDLGEWRADDWSNGRITIRANNHGSVCQVNAQMDSNPDFGNTGKVFAKVIESAPDFALGVSYMLHAEQSGGDMWWHGWGLCKQAFIRTGLEHDSPNLQAAVNERADLLERVRKLEEAVKRAIPAIDLRAIQLRSHGNRQGAMTFEETAAILRAALQPEQETA